jgi:predicted NAD/FAD-binding protein
MSFSVRCDRTGLEYNGTSLNRLFAQRRNLLRPRFLGMLRDILRFHRQAPEILARDDEETTVGQYLEENRFGRSFGEHYLVPMGAALWSCPPDTFRQFPIRFLVEFMRNHFLLQLRGRPVWRVICGGSARYVEAMTRRFSDRIRLSSPVRRVSRGTDGVRISTDGVGTETYDHAILACHADQALAMLDRPTRVERELLGAFPYQRNEVVLHTDTSLLPRKRLAWASWNYHLGRHKRDRSTVTYNMNLLQGLESRNTFLVTLNDLERIHPDRVIRRYVYHHPVYARGRASAQARHEDVIGPNRTSFCGAYWGYGFHEDGVASALRVCRALERELVA